MRLAPLVEALKEYILSHGVIHVDETPVSLLAPGKGKTKKAYVWVYRTTNFVAQRAVYCDFCKDRLGEHPRRVLADFDATLVSDDYAGYHAVHRRGVRAALCWAHARRKLFEAHRDTGSEIAGQAVALIARAVRDRARGSRACSRCAATGSTATLKADRRCAAHLARGKTPGAGEGGRDRQGDRLFAEQ